MTKFNFMKTFTATTAMTLAICSQAQAVPPSLMEDVLSEGYCNAEHTCTYTIKGYDDRSDGYSLWQINNVTISGSGNYEGLSDADFAGHYSFNTDIELEEGITSVSYGAGTWNAVTVLPSTVTSIGDSSVTVDENNGTVSVIVPESKNKINGEDFRGLGIDNIQVSSSVTSIGEEAFLDTYLSSISFAPNSQLATIGPNAFYGLENLTDITLPDSLESIGYQAFGYSGLTGISIPKSVTTIGARAFENTPIEYVDLSAIEGELTLSSYAFAKNYNGDLSTFKLICNESQMADGGACSATSLSNAKFGGTIAEKLAGDLEGYYRIGDNYYSSLEDVLAGTNSVSREYALANSIHTSPMITNEDQTAPKRIYTVPEATALVKNNKNKFSIKFR